MKSKQAAPSFLVPRFLGRSEADMTARHQTEQLELFREALTRPAKVQILAMLALSDPKHLDRPTYAKIADIAEAMGYERPIKPDTPGKFPSWIYQQIEDTGLNLRRRSFQVFIREPAGHTKDGRLKYKTGLVELSILQEFGFHYEDDEGQPINLDEMSKTDLVKIDTLQGPPLYALPMVDAKGKIIRNKDGSIRRRMANGVTWTFASRFAGLAKDRKTAWVFYRDAVHLLRQYLSQPAAFDLMWITLFWKDDGLIEMEHDKLVGHLNIKSKDPKQVQNAIDAAFQVLLDTGMIDRPVTIRPSGYYKASAKTGKPRRKGKVYQWQRSARWTVGGKMIEISANRMEALNDGKAEIPKS